LDIGPYSSWLKFRFFALIFAVFLLGLYAFCQFTIIEYEMQQRQNVTTEADVIILFDFRLFWQYIGCYGNGR